MDQVDWKNISVDVAKHILGEPNKALSSSSQLRWGNKGSFVLNLESGTFYDHENNDGGGVKWLIEYKGFNTTEILKQFGVGRITNFSNNVSQQVMRSFTREQMNDLHKQAKVKVQYSESFWVMRFGENHRIKQKYAPFTKDGKEWFLKRPEGLLPLYIEENHINKPVLISEGEKAMIGSKSLYEYDVCCWHGGVGNWQKTDWSKIFGRQVFIYPDKDEVGFKCANEIANYLRSNECNVKVIKPHNKLSEKDDLWDAKEKSIYVDKKDFYEYLEKNPLLPPRGTLYFQTVQEIVANMKEPDWMIDGVCERGSIMSIFGKPKSGKSFVAIAMACSIATGKDFYGRESIKSTVAYICGEGNASVSRRFVAYEQYFNINLSKSPLLISNRGARILDDDDYEHLIKVLKIIEIEHGSLGCVVLDTLARTFGGGDENSTSDMNKYIQRIDAIKEEFGCTILIVHHTGHNSGTRSRGSSVLPASLDYEFKVIREDVDETMFVNLTQTLVKDGMAIDPLNFKFLEISPLLGFDNVRSGVLEQTLEVPQDKRLTRKREETIFAIEKYQEEKDEKNPSNIWITPTVLASYMNIKKSTLMTRLTDLKEQDMIHYDKNKGAYQSKKWDSEVF